MDNQIYYSASKNGFYFSEDKENCIAGAGWPEDALLISERWYQYLLTGQAAGRQITANQSGQPILVSPPVDYVGVAESEKTQRLVEATTQIAPLQDAVDLAIATDEEFSRLNAWKKYRVEVNRIDTSLAPDINWPIPPEL